MAFGFLDILTGAEAAGGLLSSVFGKDEADTAYDAQIAAQNQQYELDKQALEFAQEEAQIARDLALAPVTTPTGRAYYTPERGYVTEYSPEVQAIIDAINAAELAQSRTALSQDALDRQSIDRSRAEGAAADTLLAQYMHRLGSPTLTARQVQGDTATARRRDINDTYDRFEDSISRQLVRGGGGEQALAELASTRAQDLAASAPTRTEALTEAFNFNAAEQNNILNQFAGLRESSKGGGFSIPSGTFTTAPQIDSGAAVDASQSYANSLAETPTVPVPPANYSTSLALGSGASVLGNTLDSYYTRQAYDAYENDRKKSGTTGT